MPPCDAADAATCTTGERIPARAVLMPRHAFTPPAHEVRRRCHREYYAALEKINGCETCQMFAPLMKAPRWRRISRRRRGDFPPAA